ncbi:hypothetical protein [Deinococcus multiflagellatus]|uniref:DUF2946 domain-containing protein n=1 Tax=Deinococcus multiflagellatus TaxID=1656887 RepID=A0ABW1ZS62_9DEIO|nr:hypothetical protein [Deinococcus multiflagellatus]MBZ9713524.1 hypothetical protein [Deinococcus multiflagellatus]
MKRAVGGPAAVARQQRWLLAALCLLASFAFLGRTTSPGLGLPSPFQAMQVAERQAPQPAQTQAASAPAHAGHPPAHRDMESAPSARPALTQAAPNAPPHGPAHAADHGAHCPFCFTAAFALEAEGALSLARPAAQAPVQALGPRGPWLAPVRHAEARAPPQPRLS